MNTFPVALVLHAWALFPFGPQDPRGAATKSAAELIALAPVIDSGDDRIKSIVIAGFVKAGKSTRLDFRATYQAPDRHTLTIRDGNDGTPLLFSSNRGSYLYDPITPAVLYASGGGSSLFSLHDIEDGLGLLFRWNLNNRGPRRLFLDLKSLIGEFADHESIDVFQVSGGSYTLSDDREGARLIYRIDLGRPYPYVGFEVCPEGSDEPTLRLGEIAVNEPLEDEGVVFPDPGRLGEEVRPADWVIDSKQPNTDRRIFQLVQMRMAIKEPKLRDSLAFPPAVGTEFDWGRAGRADEKFSRMLKELVPDRRKSPDRGER